MHLTFKICGEAGFFYDELLDQVDSITYAEGEPAQSPPDDPTGSTNRTPRKNTDTLD